MKDRPKGTKSNQISLLIIRLMNIIISIAIIASSVDTIRTTDNPTTRIVFSVIVGLFLIAYLIALVRLIRSAILKVKAKKASNKDND